MTVVKNRSISNTEVKWAVKARCNKCEVWTHTRTSLNAVMFKANTHKLKLYDNN